MSSSNFDPAPVLSYLSLPLDYEPSPKNEPLKFLTTHLNIIPTHLLQLFSSITTPKQRTTIAAIRNRRLKYAESNPPELSFSAAKSTWPTLWQGRELRGKEEAKEEQEWADKEFVPGAEKHVGKLGNLLGEYAQEREAEKVRAARRAQAELEESIPEEDEDTDDEEDAEVSNSNAIDEEPFEDSKAWFLRTVKEKFIYGLLDNIDYDKADWDEQWDAGDRENEDKWFDEEEESLAIDDETEI
ncbi:hypothetical protein C8Q75DRAFT_802500 [Abortiporus biennis]|nr:hypothetical protein C8Q75DRAFT_802500 [Abortiporus biennis]